MKVQDAAKQIKLRGWAAQVDACNQSGLPVKRWCRENGVAVKSYYYHLKRVREELLSTLEIANTIKPPRLGIAEGGCGTIQAEPIALAGNQSLMNTGEPVFAALPIPKAKGAAVTVRVGGCAIEIQNDADETIIEQVLKAVARL
jgi:hypothetical protein